MLPKIKQKISTFNVPSTGKSHNFRPYLVGEEKILLMAKSGEDPAEIFRAIKQVINNCCLDEGFDVDTLAVFDLEYLFIKLRAISVSNMVTVTYRDYSDGKSRDFVVDLDSVEVIFDESVSKIIKVDDETGMMLKYPVATIFDDEKYLNSNSDAFYELVLRCVEKIWTEDEVYTEFTQEELEGFLDSCPIRVLEDIEKFLSKTPHLYHKIEYKNDKDEDRVIEMKTLTDFFTLG